MPLFSIVIPTRNRAHLLGYALQSAMNQTFDDYEIVVSDNYSDDETAKVVQRLGDSRVRYFRTDRVLSMPDSWEFALSKSRGEWVTFLTDRCVISTRLLRKVADTLLKHHAYTICWHSANYFLSSWYDSAKRNQLNIPSFSKQVVELDSQSQLAKLFGFVGRETHTMPLMLNSCCHRDIKNKVIRQLGRFFLPTCPDYTSCATLLSSQESYIYIDIPLLLFGTGRESTGASTIYDRQGSVKQFVHEFQGQDLFKHVPLNSINTINAIADSLLRVKQAMSDHLTHVQLDWEQYFIQCYDKILQIGRQGVDISSMKREFFVVLGQQSPNLRARVRLSVLLRMLRSDIVKNKLSAMVYSSPILNYLWSSIRRRRFKSGLRIERGEDGAFNNILEALAYLEKYY